MANHVEYVGYLKRTLLIWEFSFRSRQVYLPRISNVVKRHLYHSWLQSTMRQKTHKSSDTVFGIRLYLFPCMSTLEWKCTKSQYCRDVVEFFWIAGTLSRTQLCVCSNCSLLYITPNSPAIDNFRSEWYHESQRSHVSENRKRNHYQMTLRQATGL